MTRDQLLDRLLKSYAGSYDIEEAVSDETVPALAARAHFHVDESAYMISKKAVMYATSSDEYVWFFSVPHLTDAECEECIRYAYDQGLPMCKQDGVQMVTRLTAIFLFDTAEEAAVDRIRKCRLYKSFQFSLKGWMEFHAVAADLGKESAASNRYGRETAKHLENLMHPRTPRKALGNRLFGAFIKRK